MKNKINRSTLLTSLCIMFALIISSCNDAKYDAIKNSVYLSEAQTSTSKKVMVDDLGGSTIATVRMADKMTHDVKVSVSTPQTVLDEYNKRNGTDYVMLPQTSFTLSESDLTIEIGKVGAQLVDIEIKPFTTEMEESGNTYAIPLTISSVSNGPQILQGTESYIYVMDKVITTSVPTINRMNNILMTMRKDYALTEWAVEFRVKLDLLGTAIGQYNNQAMFAAFAPSGMTGEIYTRFGDAPIKGNIFQCKNQGTQFNSVTEFQKDIWYHLAIVNDGAKIKFYLNGKLDIEIDSPGKVTNLGKDKFRFGTDERFLVANVLVSEVRFWTKGISQTQIQNNMFTINPQTEGLEAYWKLNEGTGNTFADATGHGNNAVSAGTTVWVHGVRSDEQK